MQCMHSQTHICACQHVFYKVTVVLSLPVKKGLDTVIQMFAASLLLLLSTGT